MKRALVGVVLVFALGCGSSTRGPGGAGQGSQAGNGQGGSDVPPGGSAGSSSGSPAGGGVFSAAGAGGTASGGAAGTLAASGGESGAPDGSGGAAAAGAEAGSSGFAGTGGSVRVPEIEHRSCASSDLVPESACSGEEATQIANPTSLAEEMYNWVLEAQWRGLWGVVGQYACGDAPIYRGSFSPSVNEVEEAWPDAVASLVMGEALEYIGAGILAGPHFTVFDPVSGRRTQLVQPERGKTQTSIVVEPNSSFGVSASCIDCFPQLVDRPDDFQFDYRATGEYGDGSPLVISASGWFSRVRVGEVSLEDIQTVTRVYSREVRDIMESFEPCGAELTRRSVGEYLAWTRAPEGSGYDNEQCKLSVPFSALWHLDAGQPAAHGVRALTVETPRICCQASAGEGEPDRPIECFDP